MNIFLLSFDSDIKLIFMWWLEQFGKAFNLMKHIPIFGKSVTLYHVLIAFIVFKIFIALIKFERVKLNNEAEQIRINSYDEPIEPGSREDRIINRWERINRR